MLQMLCLSLDSDLLTKALSLLVRCLCKLCLCVAVVVSLYAFAEGVQSSITILAALSLSFAVGGVISVLSVGPEG